MARLSVVVPFHNVRPYLPACLESIARQTFQDIEVVMVDDGSSDGSVAVAESYAERDPRFMLVRQDNQGLGPARNTGIKHAVGDYLAFVDSDDVLPPAAYELTVGSLERSGSDFAAGNARRFDSHRMWQSWAHSEAFRKDRQGVSITRHPELMRERGVVFKTFRRTFWDRHGLTFPGILYEDLPVMIRAYVLADTIDIVREPVYYWRLRDRGGLSITQRALEADNLADRMVSVLDVAGFMREQAPALKPAFDRTMLNVDVAALIDSMERHDDATRERLADTAARYLAGVDERVFRDLTAINRLRYHLLRHRMVPELLEVLEFQRAGIADAGVHRRGVLRRWYAAYPFRDDRRRGIPQRVYDVTREMTVHGVVDALDWRDGRLRVEGYAHIRHLPMAAEHGLRLWLDGGSPRRRVDLDVTRVDRPDVTAWSDQSLLCLDGAGFSVDIDPAALDAGGWRPMSWQLKAEIASSGERRVGVIANASPNLVWPAAHHVDEGVRIQTGLQAGGGLTVRVTHPSAWVSAASRTGDGVELSGRLTAPADDADLVITPEGGTPIRVPMTMTGGGGFRVRLRAADLRVPDNGQDAVENGVPRPKEAPWTVRVDAADRQWPLAVGPDVPEARHARDSREIALVRTRWGNLGLLERTARLVVDDLRWDGDALAVAGDCADPGTRPERLELRRARTHEEHTVPLAWHGDRFTARVPVPGAYTEGSWHLFASGEPVLACTVPPAPHTAGLLEITPVRGGGDALRLDMRQRLPIGERGLYAQRRMQERVRDLVRGSWPKTETVVFETTVGHPYSGHPRAIYEELRRRDSRFTCVWVTRRGMEPPPGAQSVLAGSEEHYKALAWANVVVSDGTPPRWIGAHNWRTWMQAWPGTPLKRLGADVPPGRVPHPGHELAAGTDVLLSPGPFASEVFRRALGHAGEILECGSPGTAVLDDPSADRSAARARLGLPPGKRVILYAPTFRDDHLIRGGRRIFPLEWDLREARAALGDDHIVLVRPHPCTTDRPRVGGDGFAFDVANHPEIADLYLAADLLVTDYSSAMADFARTGRPILLFTPDLDVYCDRGRGLYLDLEKDGPGPVLRTSADLTEAIRDTTTAAYGSFTAAYAPAGPGASAVVDRILH